MHQENDEWTIEYDEDDIYNNRPVERNEHNDININSLDFYLLKSPQTQNILPEDQITIINYEKADQKNNLENIENYLSNLTNIKPCDKCNPKLIQCEICKGHFNIKFFYENHQQMCEKIYKIYEESINLIICPDCNLQIKTDEYKNHVEKCSSNNPVNQSISCRYCSNLIALHLIEEHEIICEKLQTDMLLMNEKVECSLCKEQVPYFELEVHETHCRKMKKNHDEIESQLLSYRNYPTNWDNSHPQAEKITCDLDLIPLNCDSDEFKEIESMFYITLRNSGNKIVSIKRIQNIILWEKYQLEKSLIEKEKNFVEEKLLFFAHQNIQAEQIYKNGFDISFAQDNSPWGRGIYFYLRADKTINQSQSLEKNQNSKVVFVANVLTGVAHITPKQNTQLRKPPFYDASKYIYYDSITNTENFTGSLDADQIFIVYNNEKAYPKYMIEFTYQPINNNNAMILD